MRPRHHLIVGAGVTGLSCAYSLIRQGEPVTVLEASDRVGGWCCTEYCEEGYTELGPRTFAAARTPELLALVGQLGLDHHLRWAPACSQRRFIWDGSQMLAIPPDLKTILATPLLRRLALEAMRELLRSPQPPSEESLHNFLVRRFGPAAAALAVPIVQGVWAGDPKLLDASACLGGLVKVEQQGGVMRAAIKSLLRRTNESPSSPGPKRGLWTLDRGVSQLIEQLAKQVGSSLRIGCKLQRVLVSDEGWRLETSEQNKAAKIWEGSHLWMCLPHHELRRVQGPWSDPPTLSMETLRVVDCIWEQPDILPKGFGYLCLTPSQEPLLGAVFDSSCFPHQMPRRSKATLMQGGASQASWLDQPDAVAQAVEGFCRHTGLPPPDRIHPRMARHAIAQYHVGIQKQMLQWQQHLQHLPPVQFLGASWGGASVEDCVRSALTLSKAAGGSARSVAVPGYIQKTSCGEAQDQEELGGIGTACPRPTHNKQPC